MKSTTRNFSTEISLITSSNKSEWQAHDRLIHMHYCTCNRISLCLISITSSMSFAGTFLRSRSRHLPRSRDRSRTRQGDEAGSREAARRRGTRERGCPNGIRISMGREPCTKQPRRHPAFARIATLTPWLVHGKHCVSGAEADLAQSGRPLSWDPPPRGRLRLQHRRL